MAEEAFAIMKKASIFMILAQTIIYFRPQESYEKYLKLLLHLMLLAVLFFPVIELLNKDVGSRMQNSMNVYAKQVEELLYGTGSSLSITDETYLSTVENEVKLRLNNYSDATGYVVETAEIQGVSESGGQEGTDNVKVVIRTRNASRETSAVQVDKIQLTGNAPKSQGNQTETEKMLVQQYAQILGMNQADLEVIADGAD